MKISKLIKKLADVYKLNPDANVYIYDDEGYPRDFTGFGCDDNCEVELYVSCDDKRV